MNKELNVVLRVLKRELDAFDNTEPIPVQERLFELSLITLIEYFEDLAEDSETTQKSEVTEAYVPTLNEILPELNRETKDLLAYFISGEDYDCKVSVIMDSVSTMVLLEDYSIEDISSAKKLVKELDAHLIKYRFMEEK